MGTFWELLKPLELPIYSALSGLYGNFGNFFNIIRKKLYKNKNYIRNMKNFFPFFPKSS